MPELVRIYTKPQLNSPNMLAAWPGVGSVSMIVARYLQNKIDLKLLAEINAPQFFDPVGVVVRDNIVEEPRFPRSAFYYWQNQAGRRDLILFIGEDQPTTKAYELASCVLEAGMSFEMERVYTCAAAVTRIHHTEQPSVWGVATTPEAQEDLKAQGLLGKGNFQIAGLNGLVLGVAKEKGLEGICLLGEVPSYATQIQNPMAALAVMEVLARLLDIDIDLAEIKQLSVGSKEQMKRAIAEITGDYIDYFTEPIWESGEEDEEEWEE